MRTVGLIVRHNITSTDMNLIKGMAAALAALSIPAFAAGPAVDPQTPGYEAVSGISGNLNGVGSDTLNNLMTLWGESFCRKYPSVRIGIEGKGSATGPPALIQGTAQLAPMSRDMKREEIDAFEKKYGYKPTCIKVALDAVGFFVHKDNPVQSLSLGQIDGMFSSTLKRGGADIVRWDQAGVDALKGKPVSLYGRNSASGTNGFVKEVALKKGDFKNSVKEQPGSSAVIQGIGSDRQGIGYSGIGYLNSSVKALALSAKDGGKAIEPTYDNCVSGDYPLARYLVIYINKKPGVALDPLTREFIRFVLSREGQEIVVRDGYFPVPAKIGKEMLQSLE